MRLLSQHLLKAVQAGRHLLLIPHCFLTIHQLPGPLLKHGLILLTNLDSADFLYLKMFFPRKASWRTPVQLSQECLPDFSAMPLLCFYYFLGSVCVLSKSMSINQGGGKNARTQTQAGLELTLLQSMTLNFWSSCLQFLSASNTDVLHNSCFYVVGDKN